MVELMTKEAKEEFSEAVREVGELVSDGTHTPKAAIKKVASERGYGRPMTENLARTYDIGVTWNQFDSDSLQEKVASVAIAKSNEVADELFGGVEKEGNTMNTYLTDNVPDYVQESRKPNTHPVTKAASAMKQDRDEGPDINVKSALRDIEKAAKCLDRVNSRIRRFGKQWNAHVKRARTVIEDSSMDFEEIYKRAAALFGNECRGYMDVMSSDLGEDRVSLEKTAGRYYMVDEEEEPFSTISEGVDMSKEASTLLDMKRKLRSSIQKVAQKAIKHCGKDQRDTVRGWVKKKTGIELEKRAQIENLDDILKMAPKDLSDVEKKQVEVLQNQRREQKEQEKTKQERQRAVAEGAGEAVSGTVGGIRDVGDSILDVAEKAMDAEDVQSSPNEHFGAEHMSKLKHIKSKAMLNSFISSDPILSRRDPDRVITAFNRIRDLRPDLVEHPSLVRSMVRQLTETSDRQDPEALRKFIDKAKQNETGQE